MTKLILDPNLEVPDDFYARLIATHDGLDDDESAALNARLILILANHIGDMDVLEQAFEVAKSPSAQP